MNNRVLRQLLIASVCAALAITTQVANAVDTEGKILILRGGGGTSTTGRMSIYMGKQKPTDVCGLAGWYACDGATTGNGRVRTDLLISAHQHGKTIVAFGTGNCDPYGVEKVSGFDVK